ncbi:MAG: T9SS type A sorting domain-containing protein, partial [Vicingaceae bacterium]
SDPHPNNFASANCETTTTICGPVGQTILVNFNTFAMFNTNSAFDWMKIYEGTGTGGTVLFNNDAGGPNNGPAGGGTGSGFGDCGDDDLSALQNLCSNGSNCLTFEFHASGVVDREGWDASVLLTTGPTCVLPITLVSFNGSPYSEHNLLEWVTASEINNDYFILERSDNGIDFEEISNISGAGNSNKLINYSFSHRFPKNIEYYRLKQVDFDGKYSYSKIIVIKSNNYAEINIYPNPTKNNLFFDFIDGYDGMSTITYTSVLGRIFEEKINISSDTKKYQAKLFSNLTSGVYFIQIKNELGQILQAEKIIKE